MSALADPVLRLRETPPAQPFLEVRSAWKLDPNPEQRSLHPVVEGLLVWLALPLVAWVIFYNASRLIWDYFMAHPFGIQ